VRRAAREDGVVRAAERVILATLDTKGAEAMVVAELLQQRGHCAWVIDTGFRHPPAGRSDVDREEVVREAGLEFATLRGLSREAAVRAMGEGAGRLLARHAAD